MQIWLHAYVFDAGFRDAALAGNTPTRINKELYLNSPVLLCMEKDINQAMPFKRTS